MVGCFGSLKAQELENSGNCYNCTAIVPKHPTGVFLYHTSSTIAILREGAKNNLVLLAIGICRVVKVLVLWFGLV